MLPFIVSTLAPIVNCIQLIPQLYKTYITKSVKDLSIYSLLLILTTNLLWLLHGYFITDISLIVAGVMSMIINISILALYFLYRKTNYTLEDFNWDAKRRPTQNLRATVTDK